MSNLNHGKPFLKWAGGKSKIVPAIFQSLDAFRENGDEWGLSGDSTYHEPFLGSGTVFFSFKHSIMFSNNTLSVLSDFNPVLISTMKTVKSAQFSKLLSSLETFRREYIDEINKLGFPRGLGKKQRDKRYYYNKRRRMNVLISKLESKKELTQAEYLEIAGIMIFLNKTCYNGLWRVNSKGENNVPEGKYLTPTNIYQPEILLQCNNDLQNTVIKHQSFVESFHGVKSGDLVYLDPPYLPLKVGEYVFTSYASDGFGLDAHVKLAGLAAKAAAKGARIIASNNDSTQVRELYLQAAKREKIAIPIFRSVPIKRTMNSKGQGRITVNELLIFLKK